MKDFSTVLEDSQPEQKKPHPKMEGFEIREKTVWEQAKDQLVKFSGPFVLAIFTGPFNNASILLQVADKPISDTFNRKIESAG